MEQRAEGRAAGATALREGESAPGRVDAADLDAAVAALAPRDIFVTAGAQRGAYGVGFCEGVSARSLAYTLFVQRYAGTPAAAEAARQRAALEADKPGFQRVSVCVHVRTLRA